MQLKVTSLSAVMGAEISGVDLAHLTDQDFKIIQKAFHDHLVIAVRDQNLSPQDQIAFTSRFGELETQANALYAIPGYPEVLVISNDIKNGRPVGLIDAGDFWHSDSQSRDKPSTATILHSLKNPSQGGDTQFANMYLAYDALPDDVKRRIQNLHGVNASSKLKNKRVTVSKDRPDGDDYYKSALEKPDAIHPIVRTHPETGKKALYASPRFTIGIKELHDSEGQELLDYLFDHQMRAEFRYDHKWKNGDLVMWDNRCLMHCAGGGYKYPDTRMMHRTVIAGDRPV